MAQERKKLRLGQKFNPENSAATHTSIAPQPTPPTSDGLYSITPPSQQPTGYGLPVYPGMPSFDQQTVMLMQYNYMMQQQSQLAQNPYYLPPTGPAPQSPFGDFEIDYEEYQKNPQEYLKTLPPAILEQLQDQVLEDEEAKQEDEINAIISEIDEVFHRESKDCKCCKGYIYRCKDFLCRKLEVCKCYASQQEEQEHDERLIEECRDCSCCHGYVYTCLGEKCKLAGVCHCFEGGLGAGKA